MKILFSPKRTGIKKEPEAHEGQLVWVMREQHWCLCAIIMGFIEKSLIPDSAGKGKYRGGLGQRVVFEVISEKGSAPFGT